MKREFSKAVTANFRSFHLKQVPERHLSGEPGTFTRLMTTMTAFLPGTVGPSLSPATVGDFPAPFKLTSQRMTSCDRQCRRSKKKKNPARLSRLNKSIRLTPNGESGEPLEASNLRQDEPAGAGRGKGVCRGHGIAFQKGCGCLGRAHWVGWPAPGSGAGRGQLAGRVSYLYLLRRLPHPPGFPDLEIRQDGPGTRGAMPAALGFGQ